MLVLPRQARDNHGEKSETNTVLCRGLVSPPPSELSRWRDVLQNLAPIPVGEAISPPNTSVLLPQEWPIFTFPDEKHDNPVRKLLLVSSLPDICPESVCLSWQIIVFHRGERGRGRTQTQTVVFSVGVLRHLSWRADWPDVRPCAARGGSQHSATSRRHRPTAGERIPGNLPFVCAGAATSFAPLCTKNRVFTKTGSGHR